MPHRREFLAAATALLAPEVPPKRIAVVNTAYYQNAHAYHIVGRFVNGYTLKGQHHQPAYRVARMFTDQYAGNDLARATAKQANIAIAGTVAEAVGDASDIVGVLLIGEQGNYPANARGQVMYPRYELFQEIVAAFRKAGRTVPVFNDKHLSYDFAKARAMYDAANELKFPLMAGSSLPVTWRVPEWEPEYGAKIEEAVVVYYADKERYGFHALEVLQCLMERRKGGETGVKSVQTLAGDAVWRAWDRGAFSKELAEAALRRSGTRDFGRPRDHVPNPSAFLLEYRDGTRAAVLNLSGYVADFTAAVRVAGDPKPQSVGFILPAPPGARFFDALTFWIEALFAKQKSPYPVERTLLTSVVLDFAQRSAADGGAVQTHEAMHVAYAAPNASFFFRGPWADE